LIVVRPFINTDPPRIAELWNHQSQSRCLAQPMTTALLEMHVLAKPYFEADNLLVAEEEDKVVGFVHVACCLRGPETAHQGIVAMLMTSKSPHRRRIQDQLLLAAEQRLGQLGATTAYYYGNGDFAPFYFGLYGGSGNRGVVASDPRCLEIAVRNDYHTELVWSVMQRTIHGFRPPVNREQMTLRRAYIVVMEDDPVSPVWSEACLFAQKLRTRFILTKKHDPTPLTSVTFAQLDLFSQIWGVRAMALIDWENLATLDESLMIFFLGEAFRQLGELGIASIETQIPTEASEFARRLETLGLSQIDQVSVLSKSLVEGE